MAINFPNSPTTNQTVIVGTDTWVWNGVAWEVEPAIIIPTQTGQSGKYLTTNGTAVSWGTVTATAASVGLGNVTNESKATMFASPTFTGTVAGVTATHVGLGNVTNESKATMFASPTFTGNTVISVTDNSNAALRITQLGTGNALLVEDITNPDASPFVITNNGSVVVGKDTPLTAYKLEINTVGQPFSTARFVNSSSESIHFLVRSRSATPGTYSSLIAQDGIASLQFAGDDGAAFIQAASIAAFVDGTPGLNDMPGRLVFSTTADGASTPTERMRISSAGVVSLSSTEASTSTTTGALTVGGGVGIAGNLYVGGSILSRINSRITTAASASTLTPDVSVSDIYAYTALAVGLTVNAPIGTPVDGNKLMFRLLDNGTARALTWNATYTIIGVTLPTTTVVNKTTYVGCIYNANNTRWDVIAVSTQA